MDVLAYSAFNQQAILNQQSVAKNSCLATKCSETAGLQAVAAGFNAAATCWVQCIEPCLLRDPSQCSLWCFIPDLTSATGGFKVCRCAGNSFFNYGACCLWTVPAGVTRVRFQIWGAGGSSGGGCCCGGSPFGATGAYASVIIPVTAGCQYTLCAGCAAQCTGTNGVARIPGCQSFVIGSGLCNFCANGGQGRMGNWMAAYGRAGNTALCRLGILGWNYCGSYFCNGGSDYCFTSSCARTNGSIPYVAGAPYFGTTTSAASPSIVYGIRGMWPSISIANYGNGSQCHPPIYGFSAACSVSWSSTCNGCVGRACCGINAVPGAGGWFHTVYSGCTSAWSDYGRGGMVCVTFR